MLSPRSPVPEITWKRANGVPFPSKVKMKYANAVLEIPSFQQEDTGGYECVVENKMGKNTAAGLLAFYGTLLFILIVFFTFDRKNYRKVQNQASSFLNKCQASHYLS